MGIIIPEPTPTALISSIIYPRKANGAMCVPIPKDLNEPLSMHHTAKVLQEIIKTFKF